jgi:outer membrane receptor protein involved in Fe transport
LLPLAAQAQEGGADDEIVVTAQKREERLRDVPQSITAVTAETLERLQANSFEDYVAHVPGLTALGGQAGASRLTLRGLNTGSVASTVGTYVDETPYGSSTSLVNAAELALDLDPFDVQRIEVLRGPQGTLYGASTLGGVIKFVMTPPSPDAFEARFRGTAENTADGDPSYAARAAVNIPLGDQAALRLSGIHREQGGFVDDPSRGASDINSVETSGIRAAFLLNATEDLTIRLSAHLQDIDSDAPNGVDYLQDPLEPVAGDLDQSRPFSQMTDVSYHIYNGTIDWDLGFASLISSSSYSELDQTRQLDGTMAFGLSSFLANDVTQEKFTQEVRLVSPSSERFEWVLGAFYAQENGLIDQEIFFGTPPGTVTGLTANIASEYEEIAVFGGITYKFTPQFDVSIGARLAQNDQTVAQGGTAVSTGGEESSDDATTYSVAPRYRINDNTMIYARVASGYRPGGPNILGVPSIIPATFDPDETVNYELGVKTDLFGGLLRLDAAVFHVDWTDIQLLVFDGVVSGNANGSSAESEGVEWSATLVPTDGLTLVWSGAYTDARLTGDTDPIVVGGASGDPLPNSPEWASTFDVNYEWTVFGDTGAYVGGAWRYVGEQSNGFPGTGGFLYGAQMIDLPSYNVSDLRGGLEFERFEVELFAKNIGDERAVTDFGGFGATLPDAPNGSATLIRPRTIGVSLSTRF